MAVLKWDQDTQRLYETGTKNGVLYPKKADGTYDVGVAWNGLTAISESPSGAEETALYADDDKYLSLRSKEEFGGTIEAYTYPDEWAICDGSAFLDDGKGFALGQQTRRGFGLCYRTTLGNDVEGNDYGYKLHLVYNALASPSEKSYATINDSPEAITFSWTFTTTPVEFRSDLQKSSTLTINSKKVSPEVLTAIEDKLYGTANSDPEMPTPDWIISVIESGGSSGTFTEVSTSSEGYADKSPKDEGWYEKTGENPDKYTRSKDTVVDISTTYYVRSTS